MDKLTSMRVFVETVERGSLTAAAERLGLSRAKASRHLAELETWLGIRLLHRSTRSLSLTPAGEKALADCYSMLGICDKLLGIQGEDRSVPQGVLRITCSQSFSDAYLMAVINDYLLCYPQVKIELLVSEEAVNLVDERIDLAIRMTNHLEPGVIAKRLGLCRSAICASPDYLRQRGVPAHPKELLNHACLTHSQFASRVWRFFSGEEEVSVAIKSRISANETGALKQSALAGLGVAFLPYYAIADEAARGELQILMDDYTLETIDIYAVFKSRLHVSSALRELLTRLEARFKRDPFWH